MSANRDRELGEIRGARALTRRLRAIDQRARQYRSPGFQIPVLDEDPPDTSTTNLWQLRDGRVRTRLDDGTVRQLSGASTGSTTSAVTAPVESAPERYQADYTPTWARTFCAVHDLEGGQVVGYGTTALHGERRLMVGFNQPAIAADLAGSVIRSVWLSVMNVDTETGGSIDIHLGVHNSTSPPDLFAGTRRDVWVGRWPRTGYNADWTPTSEYIGRGLRDGLVRGLTVDQPLGDPYAGELDWTTVRLRVAYTK